MTAPALSENVFRTSTEAAQAAAHQIAAEIRQAVRARGRALLALSGGRSPLEMLRALALEPVPWAEVELFQVDERAVPSGDPARNWDALREALVRHVALPPAQQHPMEFDRARDPACVARQYAAALAAKAGDPPILDVVHLGLGADGHTASLVPGDPVLEVRDAAVAATGSYQGHRRVTLTYPTLNRARRVLWLVLGDAKRAALQQLREGNPSLPAARITRARAVVFCDAAAAGSSVRPLRG